MAPFNFALLSAFFLLGITNPSHASKKTPDVYPATEDEIDGTPVTAKPLRSKPKNVEKEGFDPVPADQIEGISRRLKWVDLLLKKYGRAYDYRNHTIKDLEAILAQLDDPGSSL